MTWGAGRPSNKATIMRKRVWLCRGRDQANTLHMLEMILATRISIQMVVCLTQRRCTKTVCKHLTQSKTRENLILSKSMKRYTIEHQIGLPQRIQMTSTMNG